MYKLKDFLIFIYIDLIQKLLGKNYVWYEYKLKNIWLNDI